MESEGKEEGGGGGKGWAATKDWFDCWIVSDHRKLIIDEFKATQMQNLKGHKGFLQ